MINIRTVMKIPVFALICSLFMQCSSIPKLQEKAPTEFGEVYMQSWVAGVEGGGSGINVFIETMSDNVVLDSIYFRGEVAQLETKSASPKMYIGRFVNEGNQMNEPSLGSSVESHSEPKSENPFKLEDNACVVSYKDGDKTKYFKLTDIKEKPADLYPSAKPQSQNNLPKN
ncbi:hypothetical protein Q2T40_19020 [Winogradskyella maritima]|uniref:Lipoprotein n=1 Tax=Winogradskyella maritima TaxID=1517766 RepID=A0ABV8ADK7_9FLAO|nr:hypothetical protein [Winogradskyella maritima]